MWILIFSIWLFSVITERANPINQSTQSRLQSLVTQSPQFKWLLVDIRFGWLFDVKMLSSKISEKCLHCFYLIGLSCYNPYGADPVNRCAVFCQSIPAIGFLLIGFVNSGFAFNRFAQKQIDLNECLYAVNILLMVVTVIMAFKRSSFLRGDTKCIWKYFVNLEALILNRFKLELHFDQFIGNYIRKLCFSLLLFTCLMLFKIIHRMNAYNAIRQIGALNIFLTTLLINFHILFYIDVFNYIFETINKNALKTIEINQTDAFVIEVKRVNYSEQIIQLFQMMKLIHFKMWKIVQVMNQDFGATLTLLIIQSTNTSIQSFYWIILELYEDDLSENIRIISMYYLSINFLKNYLFLSKWMFN